MADVQHTNDSPRRPFREILAGSWRGARSERAVSEVTKQPAAGRVCFSASTSARQRVEKALDTRRGRTERYRVLIAHGFRRSSWFVLGLLAAATGCTPVLQNRVPADAISPDRLVAVPPHVLIYTLDLNTHAAVEDQPTEAIATTAAEVLRKNVDRQRARFADREALAACGPACAKFYQWGGRATLEIGLQREQIKSFGFHSVSDWAFHDDLSAVRASLGADFILFVTLKQTRQPNGQRTVYAPGHTYIHGAQIDAACVADLRDGAMVWCTSLQDDIGDLADPGRVLVAIHAMLKGLFVRVPPRS